MTSSTGLEGPLLGLLLLLGAGGLLALSGVFALVFGRRSPWGERVACAATLLACVAGLAGALPMLAGAKEVVVDLPSPFPGQRSALGLDALSAWFVVPVLVVGGLGSVYRLAYWPTRHHPRNGRRLGVGYGLLLAGLVLVLLARDAVSFLVAWEAMALTTFFLVTTEDHDAMVRRAGWLYLLYSHAALLALFALFTMDERLTGSLAFDMIPASAPSGGRTAFFLLAVLAFGIKAGAMPLHSWLPAAHASAPSHVSAVMSGVVIKMGVYGLVRTSSLLAGPPLAWGVGVLALGAFAAFFGVVFALSQHDLKRLLAYHSIENIGIILLGLGLALVGRSAGRPEWVLLGMAGCLFHVWNHAVFKSLLFFGAGSVMRSTGSRELERMGGLARRMPVTATTFLVGSVAICGLPPLNGFVSELIVYLGFARTAMSPESAWAALAAPGLAATGALAVACFVKVVGIVFLGTPRSTAASSAGESPATMLVPMAVLAGACALLGLAPALVAPALERAAAAGSGTSLGGLRLATLVPFGWMAGLGLTLVALAGLLVLAVLPVCRRARRRQPALPTWDCGYAQGSSRLQYTASSFAEMITSRFAWALHPRERLPEIEGLFPTAAGFESHVEDTVLDRLMLPAGRISLAASAWFRALPGGQLQRYILYLLALLIPLLVWAVLGGAGR